MSRVPNRSARAAARTAASPAVAGFRPKLAVAAVAAAFSLQPQLLQAQPSGAHAIHGKASVVSNGRNVTVRTTNGAGTSHSAIDWQSFSVPGGSTTRFIQPSAASTSINRVLGGNPSAIYGTLRSNGKLVLVNPAGIAVGSTGVVDTAGFTASTLSMRDADAVAGRLVFQGAGGPLTVDGHVLARRGDVVLVGSSVQVGSGAVVQSEGATLVAAGERVALTGRGLEGIRLEVNAGNEVVNLGTLAGDAVGIFAGTLRHSGHIAADAVTTRGGKVVLQATGGDAYVRGTVTATAGDRGGSIDVFGERVALEAGALLQASGRAGGGQVRVGGDYQGANAEVPNAKRVYMDADARIEADATQQGDGGRVIVWSDEVTRMHGNISARGGDAGGDGGFAEVSGREHLAFTGRVDLRAAQGRKGTLLLDPEDITIIRSDWPVGTFPPVSENVSETDGMFEPTGSGPSTITDTHLNTLLEDSDVHVKTSSTSSTGNGGQITMESEAYISWSTDRSLTLEADKGINLEGSIDLNGGGTLVLHAKNGDVVFQTISADGMNGSAGGNVRIFATGGVSGQEIQATGSNGVEGDGANGGNVELRFGGALSLGSIDVSGGDGSGDYASFGPGGKGGNGGTVTIERTGGDLLLSGLGINAWGGSGGSTGDGEAAAGRGGDGGKVLYKASGRIVVDDNSVLADRGYGGWNGNYVYGGDGALGTLQTRGTSVAVQGWLTLNAVWNNSQTLKVLEDATISGYGILRNAGELHLSRGAHVKPTVENSGLVKIGAGDARLTLAKNTGTVDVLQGATLYAEGFSSNAGILNVNGTLQANTYACGECGYEGFAPLESEGPLPLVNEAGGTITGSGTLAVYDIEGTGWLENHGKIAPGGVGSTGKLTIDGNLRMHTGSVLQADLVNTLAYDILAVTGTAVTGGTVEVNHPAGASIAVGDRFAVLQAGTLDAGTLPGVGSSAMGASASGNNLVLSATTAVPGAGTPQQQAQQQVMGEIITFQQLFEQQREEDQGEPGRDDIVVTDTSCLPP